MAEILKLRFRFLQPLAHGRCDGDEPEWPPSPLRVFQAMTAAVSARWNEREDIVYALPALRVLQSSATPEIVACVGSPSEVRTQYYVPDNTADLLVPSWKKGESNKGVTRTDKVVRPIHLDGETVSYLFQFEQPLGEHFETLRAAARSVTHLGWGIDMVVGDAKIVSAEEAAQLQGERWTATNSNGTKLRVPTQRTLDDLVRKHRDFLGRVTSEGYRPVPPLREYKLQSYRNTSEPEPRPCCVFQILRPDAKGYRPFGTASRTRDVAAWVRHAVADVCRDWEDIASFVHGHSEDGGANRGPNSNLRFQYLPLPTIASYDSRTRFGAIRRVVIAAPIGFDDRINFIRKRLIGKELTWEGKTHGILNLAGQQDWVSKQYTGTATCWNSVTPVILDGFDDCNPAKTKRLICKALSNAGIKTEAEFEWQSFGYRAGVEPANAFLRPAKLNGTMVHLRLKFAKRMAGPIALGAGRFRGFGLMAIDDQVG